MSPVQSFRFSLLSDGSSDRALLPILRWTLRQNGLRGPIQEEFADLRDRSSGRQLAERVQAAIDYYPCELLFVHRDAETQSHSVRVAEIRRALQVPSAPPPAVCVVPVRMQEAWLLFDETAIRHAAANRNGRVPLNMPHLRQLESIADPKAWLHELLRTASELYGRRRKKFRVEQAAFRVSQFIEDFSPLRNLSAFSAFEDETREVLTNHFREFLAP